MKRYVKPLLLLLLAAAAAAVLSQLRPRPEVGPPWSPDEMNKWLQDNRWLEVLTVVGLAFVSMAGTLVGAAMAVVTYREGRRRRARERLREAERLARANKHMALEHNYLLELIDWFNESRRDPLSLDEGEIIELRAEFVDRTEFVDSAEQRYRIFEAGGAGRGRADEGRVERDLVAALLRRREPLVVLGDPGAGKSLSLDKVMLTLAREGLTQAEPRLPVYLRLGHFGGDVSDRERAILDFARRSLRELGGHATQIARRLQHYLDGGRIVFLLDAMDEMPRDQIRERFWAVERLRQFAGNKLLVTCRKLDFTGDLGFTRAYIQPFDRGQQRRFLLKTLGARGAAAFREIDSPSNWLRDMAGNPFFLKLLAEFYRVRGKLPESRAELMRVYEGEVFRRARGRATFPRGLEPETMRAVLARLAYLITAGGRGVTITAGEFAREFVPVEPGAAAPRLAACAGSVAAVVDVLVRERLLRAEPSLPGRDGAGPPADAVLSFHHHRLQEYYTAVYMEEFGAPLDWETGLDNIWWQETLIMLFGITERPAERMRALLQHVRERPLLCAELGGALGQLMLGLPTVGRVGYGKRKRWESQPPPLERLLAADPSNAYGLKEVFEAGRSPGDLLASLRGRGLFPAAPDPTEKDVEALLDLSPEPDGNVFGEGVRGWLEGRNAVMLDRLELGVECYRNALSKLRDSETAGEARERLAAALADFSKGGNMWETVRAIQAAARLPGIDLYSVVEPALFGKDAWCRNEAVAAVAKYPLSGNVRRPNVGFMLFLQFMKGDLLNPVPFFRSAAEAPRLRGKVPAVVLLCLVSWAALLSPFLTFFALRAYAEPWLATFGGGRPLGVDWRVWLLAFGAVVFPCAVYLSKHLWNIPVLRTTLLVCSLCVFVPLIGRTVAAGPKTARADLSEEERARENERATRLVIPDIVKTGAMAAAALVAPQAVELGALSTLALLFCFLLGSKSVIRAPVIYVRDIGALSTYLDRAQRWALVGVGIFWGGMMLQAYVGLLIFWSRISQATLIGVVLCIEGGAILYMLASVLRRDDRHRVFALKDLPGFFLEEFRESILGERPARRAGLVLLAASVGGLLLWGLYRLTAALAGVGYLGHAFLSALALALVYLVLKFSPAKGLLVFYFYRLLGRRPSPAPAREPGGRESDAAAFMRAEQGASREGISSEERFAIYREALGRVRSPLFRRMVYEAMAKAYKEKRQQKRGSAG